MAEQGVGVEFPRTFYRWCGASEFVESEPLKGAISAKLMHSALRWGAFWRRRLFEVKSNICGMPLTRVCYLTGPRTKKPYVHQTGQKDFTITVNAVAKNTKKTNRFFQLRCYSFSHLTHWKMPTLCCTYRSERCPTDSVTEGIQCLWVMWLASHRSGRLTGAFRLWSLGNSIIRPKAPCVWAKGVAGPQRH